MVKGTLGLRGDLALGELGRWALPFQFAKVGERWRLVPAPVPVPGEVLDRLRASVIREFNQVLPAGVAELQRFSDFVAISAATYDAQTNRFAGQASFKCSLPSAPPEIAIPFSLSVSPFQATIDASALRSQLLPQFNRLLGELRQSLEGRITIDLRAQLIGKQVGVSGLELRIDDVRFEGPDNARRGNIGASILLGGQPLKIGGQPVTVRNLYLFNAASFATTPIASPSFDFSACEFTPGLPDVIAALIGVPREKLGFSQLRRAAHGLSVVIELDVPGLGFRLPLGELTFGSGPVAWKRDALQAALKAGATRALLAHAKGLSGGEAGPVKNVRLARSVAGRAARRAGAAGQSFRRRSHRPHAVVGRRSAELERSAPAKSARRVDRAFARR